MALSMRWNLDDLYTSFDSKEFQVDIEALKGAIKRLNEYAQKEFGDNSNAIEKIETFIKMLEETLQYSKLSSYVHLVISVDATNQQANKYNDLIKDIFADFVQPEVLFKQFVGRLDSLDELVQKSQFLEEHAFALDEMRAEYKYSLSEKEEIIAAKYKTTGSSAWNSMKEQLFATLMVDIELDGEMKKLPATVIRNMAYEEDSAIRKTAYEAELRAYEKIERPVAFALNAIKGEAINNVKLRGYESPLDMTLKKSRMQKETLDAMFAAMKDSISIFTKYFRKKAKMLGHEGGLPFYDLFAPIGASDLHFTYDEAADFVTKNFTQFSKRMGDFARNAFDQNWIDAEMREGKHGGAFCVNLFPIKQSRVMSNFGGSFNDVSTLAHELGHAYHGYCLKDQRQLNSSYTMPIAETASTFCETLICDAALKDANKRDAMVIMENDISGAAQVIVDIYSRFLFEDEVIRRRAEGSLSVDELKDVMLSSQKQAYGEGLDHNFLHPYMWVCKPHYYYVDRNYYNFPYAYGQLFSKGLYSQYLQEGPSFAEKYDRLLAETGKNSLETVARMADIDVTDKAFWAGSLKLYEKMIDEFCEL